MINSCNIDFIAYTLFYSGKEVGERFRRKWRETTEARQSLCVCKTNIKFENSSSSNDSSRLAPLTLRNMSTILSYNLTDSIT